MRSASLPAECSTEDCAAIVLAFSATHYREGKGSDSAVDSVDPALARMGHQSGNRLVFGYEKRIAASSESWSR